MSDDELRALRDRLAGLGMTPIVSSGLMMGPFESALRSARLLDAKVIRHGLTTVLCGDRHALGDKWKELVAEVRAALAERGPRAEDEGRVLAIENHQDFGSDELAEFCETTRRGRHLPRHRQHLSGRRGAARLRRAASRPTCGTCISRTIACSSPTRAIAWCVAPSATAPRRSPRCSTSWRRKAGSLARCSSRARSRRGMCAFCGRNGGASIRRSRRPRSPPASPRRESNRLADDADHRTPWERGEDDAIAGYELDMIRRSARNMRAIGLGA